MHNFSKLSVCIVGAQGRMGNLFRNLWAGKLERIYKLDLRPGCSTLSQTDIEQTVPMANVVILSVPLSEFDRALAAIAPKLDPACLLSDFGSVKTLPMELMQKYHSGPAIGSHPLFGPESFNQPVGKQENTENDKRFLHQKFNTENNQVALVPGKRSSNTHLELMGGLFELAGCSTFTTSAAEHDRAVGTVQSLNFLSNLAYFATAANLPGLEKYVTPSFKRRLLASRTMLCEDASLFINIARYTPELRKAMQAYKCALEEAASLDNKALDNLLLLARRYFNTNMTE